MVLLVLLYLRHFHSFSISFSLFWLLQSPIRKWSLLLSYYSSDQMNVKSWNIPMNCSSQLVHVQIDWLYPSWLLHQNNHQPTKFMKECQNCFHYCVIVWVVMNFLKCSISWQRVLPFYHQRAVSVFLDTCTIIHKVFCFQEYFVIVYM